MSSFNFSWLMEVFRKEGKEEEKKNFNRFFMEISPHLSEGNAIITNIRDLFFSFHSFEQTLIYFYTTINIHAYHEDIKIGKKGIGNRCQNSNVNFLLQCFEFGIYLVKLVAKPD